MIITPSLRLLHPIVKVNHWKGDLMVAFFNASGRAG